MRDYVNILESHQASIPNHFKNVSLYFFKLEEPKCKSLMTSPLKRNRVRDNTRNSVKQRIPNMRDVFYDMTHKEN